MILKVVPEISSDMKDMNIANIKLLDYRMFNDLAIHPFIATNIWEEVVVVLGKGIRTGFIKQVLIKTSKIVLVIPNGTVIDYTIVSHVIEVYPHLSSVLRSMYMTKQDIVPVLIKEGVLFE